ncbi:MULTISPECIES: type II toxin-antitoxin system HipA family toxin [unclassified Janthinobacterium]|uniref:type II toxin-antitoxin system HipA family toxin n=1 Tax=unclassified Janthinobacterium TaxID=2610881 RepID=UPI00036359FB|nr:MULTISPECIES: HipA domain-containing protein [unclassified Janthinobacterium]MEC5163745.1 serine/threonine-protein kinase HipA [Janthinobacterium sp. CG_S6]
MDATTCTLQIFTDDAWRDAAALDMVGDPARGVDAATYLIYLPKHAMAYWGRTDAAALSVNLPVDLSTYPAETWPPFLIDLLPQGYGRAELLKQLGRGEAVGPAADWSLLCAGAGNPIGNVRVKEAHEWVAARSGGAPRGFTVGEVASRAGDFNEYLAQQGLFLAGSSGVQGEWPKILLTRARDGLLYLDHTLPDEQAQEHFIVKFGRGTDQSLANILRLEAPYMRLAKGLGLNVYADLALRERALFIPRFDREVAGGRVMRYAQESVASLCGIGGFGAAPSHNEVCRLLGEAATDPMREVIEYLKRDIANIALGNKDNHARNTAIRRRHDGKVSLTPLFDFAPMWLHPDGIARRIRWQADDGGSPVWASAIDQACAAAQVDRAAVAASVRMIAAPLATLFADARALGIEEQFLRPLDKTLENVLSQLEKI